MRRLKADAEWVRENAEREAQYRATAAQRRLDIRPEEGPLLDELAAAGIRVGSIWDLVNAKWPYPPAIPLLSAHLHRVRHPVLREGIARALTVPEARGEAARIILAELQRPIDESPHSVRWALANALTVVADESMKDTIRELISDDAYDDVRERLKTALQRLNT